MAEDLDKTPSQEEKDEEPVVYAVQKDLKEGWKFSRRDFLKGTVTTGAMTAAAATMATMSSMDQSGEEVSQAAQTLIGSIMLAVAMPAVTVVRPGQSFTQVWEFTNQGDTPWQGKVSLHLSDSDLMQAPPSIQLPAIAPGETVTIPVGMVAPAEFSAHQGSWLLQDAEQIVASGSFTLLNGCIVESPHPYTDNMDQTWLVTNSDTNAQHTRVHFSRLEVEANFDYVVLKDETGQEIQRITGSYPTGLWSNPVPGRVIQLQLVTDIVGTEWGFCVDQVGTIYLAYLPVVLKNFTPPSPCTCVGYVPCGCVGYVSPCSCQSVGSYWYPN